MYILSIRDHTTSAYHLVHYLAKGDSDCSYLSQGYYTMLCQKLDDPLRLRQLIFLNRNDDIRTCFLANKCHDPLELLVLDSHREDAEGLDETPSLPIGGIHFFHRNVSDESAGGEDSVREMRDEESTDHEE